MHTYRHKCLESEDTASAIITGGARITTLITDEYKTFRFMSLTEALSGIVMSLWKRVDLRTCERIHAPPCLADG